MHKGNSPMAGILISEGSLMEFASGNQQIKFRHPIGHPPSRSPYTAEQRRRLRAWQKAHRRYVFSWRARNGDAFPVPVLPPLPADLLRFPCGAKTRAGGTCQRMAMFPSGRCHLHGGKSTGPRTAAGKARSAANGQCPKRKGKV
jgi:hypothetical protein